MTYINRVGTVSVPEDLWADMMQAIRQLVDTQVYVSALWISQLSPEEQKVVSQSNNEWAAVLQRAREVDTLHRKMQDLAARSIREQIERGVSNGPYEG